MPKNLKELRQQRADKAKRGVSAVSEYNALSGKAERSAEDDAKLTALGAELDGLEAEVEQLDADIAAEEKTARRAGLFGSASPAGGSVSPRAAFGAARTVGEPNPTTTFGFKSMSEFALAVRGQITGSAFDERLNAAASNFHQNQGSAGEGFLVPPEYSAQVWEIATDPTDLFGMVAPEPTRLNAVIKPKDETTPWGAVGVQAAWRSEAQQMVASKLALTGELMTLSELYAFCAASSEVLDDAPMLQDRLTRQAGRALRWKLSDAVAWGDGVGKLTGFMKSSALITVPKDNGQAAKTLSVNNLAQMAAALLRAGGRPLWIANQDIIPQLVPLTIGNVPAYLPNNQPLAGDPFDGRLLGYPILFTEHAETLGNAGDITLVNLDGYYAANKSGGGIEYASSIHLYFDQGLTAFRWTVRAAGMPYLSKPVQPARGNTAKSHFVALAAR